VPPGVVGLPAGEVGRRRWRPADGVMSLPVLTLDEEAFANNCELMMRYVREQGVAIAPHAKTPMSPDLARALVEAGAWGTTVADIRQAAVMLRAGLLRLIVANEVGGRGGARRLAALLAARPEAEIYLFVDSVAAVEALAEAWREREELPPLRILTEVGAGRAGARTGRSAAGRQRRSLRRPRLTLSGVAAYEGAAAQATPEATTEAMASLLDLAAQTFRMARAAVGSNAPLIVTAGGSVHFDRVVAALGPVVRDEPATTLVLRSGAIFFHDHGVYKRGLETLDARDGFRLGGAPASASAAFRPALRLWSEVLSRSEPGLALCGLGMRDVSFDHDLPVVLAAYRGGRPLASATRDAHVVKLNDQHAFLRLSGQSGLQVGDVLEFGVSHPCTYLDRYRAIFTLDGEGFVRRALPTFFG
jgi:D-serine dehydratase